MKDIYILTHWKMHILIFLEAEDQSLLYKLKVGSCPNDDNSVQIVLGSGEGVLFHMVFK